MVRDGGPMIVYRTYTVSEKNVLTFLRLMYIHNIIKDIITLRITSTSSSQKESNHDSKSVKHATKVSVLTHAI